ncbi:MAG: 30S ribosome-binding factor RbfA [Candidatus Kapabacteria bacterium]|nr:30S ribosome-binding factor RbfA [Candidatus Kapabacteria bacterium]
MIVSIRTERVAGEIQKALATPLQRIAEELGAGLITVTEVRVSPDLQIAHVYLSVFGGKRTPGEVLQHIEDEEMGRLRHHLGRTVKLRYTPSLRLYIDDSLDRALRINAILDSVRPAEEQKDDDA